MNGITKTFNIDNSKITHCVTDNASNFGKAFRTYSIQPQAKNLGSTSDSNTNNWFCSDNSDSENSDLECEVDDTSINVDVVVIHKFS